MNIKQHELYKAAIKEINDLKSSMTLIFNKNEVKELINISRKYKSCLALKSDKKLDCLCNALLIASANRERLTAIKNDIILVQKIVSKFYTDLTRLINSDKVFFANKKQDRDILIDIQIRTIVNFSDDLDYDISVIESSIDYIDKLEFNLKTIISSLKYENGYGT